MDLIHFLFYLVISAVCAGIASRVLPVGGKGAPSGFLAMAVVGIIGAWLGGVVIGNVGPTLEGVPLVPTVIGSMLFVFALSLISGLVNKGRSLGKKSK